MVRCCETVSDAFVIWYARWNERLQATEQRKLRMAMLCGAKGDLQGAAVWQQDIIVITAGTPQLNSYARSTLLYTH